MASIIFLVFIGLASALPTPASSDAIELSAGHIARLLSRDAPEGVPGCTVDPSYSTNTSIWVTEDGHGYYAGSDCNDGSGKGHCWTDYFLMGAAHFYDNWQVTDSIDCGKTSSCASTKASTMQSCASNSSSASQSINAGIQGGLGNLVSFLASVQVSGTLSGTATTSNNDQICTTSTNSGTCTWNDQDCHSIWQSPLKIRVSGYMRRTCTTARQETNIPTDEQQKYRSTAAPDGFYTVGMQDFYFDRPTETTMLGCSALCTDMQYPDPLPGITPYQFPWGN